MALDVFFSDVVDAPTEMEYTNILEQVRLIKTT